LQDNYQGLRCATGAAVLIVAAIAATVSYLHIERLADSAAYCCQVRSISCPVLASRNVHSMHGLLAENVALGFPFAGHP
jgi:hypothetical protein